MGILEHFGNELPQNKILSARNVESGDQNQYSER